MREGRKRDKGGIFTAEAASSSASHSKLGSSRGDVEAEFSGNKEFSHLKNCQCIPTKIELEGCVCQNILPDCFRLNTEQHDFSSNNQPV